MANPVLRRSSLEAALNEPKHRVRQWVESLPPLSTRATRSRSASEFYVADLRFLFVVQALVRVGLSMDAIASVSEALYRATQLPEKPGKHPTLSMYYLDGWHIGENGAAEVKLSISLQHAWEAVDAYLGTSATPMQHVIGLGLTAVGKVG